MNSYDVDPTARHHIQPYGFRTFMSRAFSIYFEIFCIVLWWPCVGGHCAVSYHTSRSAITSAVVACGGQRLSATRIHSVRHRPPQICVQGDPSSWPRFWAVAHRPVSIENPTGSNRHRHHLPRIAISTLQPGSTQLQHYRCCGWQIRFESGGNSGGESRARERAQPIQQREIGRASCRERV